MSPSEPKSLPFAVKLILCFLVIDAAERLYEAVSYLISGDGESWPAISFFLWIVTDVLLILLLLLRSQAGRIWTLVVFAIHMVYLGFHLIREQPMLWLSLENWGQTRILLTLGFDALILHLASRPEVKAVLTE